MHILQGTCLYGFTIEIPLTQEVTYLSFVEAAETAVVMNIVGRREDETLFVHPQLLALLYLKRRRDT